MVKIGICNGNNSSDKYVNINTLTHRGRSEIATILQTICYFYFACENCHVLNQMSLNFVPKFPINNKPTLIRIIAWHQTDGKPLSEPRMVEFTGAHVSQTASC